MSIHLLRSGGVPGQGMGSRRKKNVLPDLKNQEET